MQIEKNNLFDKALHEYKIDIRQNNIILDPGFDSILGKGIVTEKDCKFFDFFRARFSNLERVSCQDKTEQEYTVNQFYITDYVPEGSDGKYQLLQAFGLISYLKRNIENEVFQVVISLTDPNICPSLIVNGEDFNDDEVSCNFRFYMVRPGITPRIDDVNSFENEALVIFTINE